MSSAAIGLVGVIIGASVTGGTQFALYRRTEARDARAAARLLRDAMFGVMWSLPVASRDRLPEAPLDFEFAVTEWREQRAVLAKSIGNDEWDWIAETMTFVVGFSGKAPLEWSRPNPDHPKADEWTPEVLAWAVIEMLDRYLDKSLLYLELPAGGRRSVKRILEEREQLEEEERYRQSVAPDPAPDDSSAA